MTTHTRAKLGSTVFALAAALFVASPSYGFWFLFGYPAHANSSGHYNSCCGPDYGYVYHHENTHDEPFFKEQGSTSEHYGAHHGSRRMPAARNSHPGNHGRPAGDTHAKGPGCPDCRQAEAGRRDHGPADERAHGPAGAGGLRANAHNKSSHSH